MSTSEIVFPLSDNDNTQLPSTTPISHLNKLTKDQRIDKLFNLYKSYGQANYIGELITQLEHMIQAATLAEKQNLPKDVIVACLCHDIGHFFYDRGSMISKDDDKNWGVKDHEKLASNWLKDLGFNELVCDLVNNHVNAKRYLVSINHDYLSNLSNASLQTLKFQGGPMNGDEILAFKSSPSFDLYLTIRKIDEAAKEPNVKLPDLEHYRSMCIECLVD